MTDQSHQFEPTSTKQIMTILVWQKVMEKELLTLHQNSILDTCSMSLRLEHCWLLDFQGQGEWWWYTRKVQVTSHCQWIPLAWRARLRSNLHPSGQGGNNQNDIFYSIVASNWKLYHLGICNAFFNEQWGATRERLHVATFGTLTTSEPQLPTKKRCSMDSNIRPKA